MTKFEILSVVLAALALFVSLNTWREQRRLQREANDLQRATDRLAKRQLDMIQEEESRRQKAQVELEMIDLGSHTYGLIFTNRGEAAALDLAVAVPGDIEEIIEDEYRAKMPKRLGAGQQVKVYAAPHLGTANPFTASVTWTNPDGSIGENESLVTW